MEHKGCTLCWDNGFLKQVLIAVFMVFAVSLVIAPCEVEAVKAPAVVLPEGAVHVTSDGISKNGDETQAIEAAKRKAVYKFLSHMIPPTKDPKSDFVRIMNQYQRFALNPKVYKKEKRKDGSLMVLLDVDIDARAVEDAFSSGVTKKQLKDANSDMIAVFIVRAVPYQSNADSSGQDDLIRAAFNSNFQKLGFLTENPDDMTVAMRNAKDYPLHVYNQAMLSSLDTYGISIMYAIIGEIRMTELRQDSMGCYGKAQVSLIAVDAMNDKRVLATFDEDYIGQGKNLRDAETMTLRKAAMDASEKIGRITLDNWNRRR